jgi:hypothetical protein
MLRCSITILLALLVSNAPALAQRNQGDVRSSSRTSVNNKNTNDVKRNTNVNRNTNVKRNTNIDVDRDIDVDIDVDHRYGGCCYRSGVGVAVATTAIVTAAVIGTRVTVLPPACTIVIINGFAYQQCGTVWYQPQFVGTTTSYVVVVAPR